MVFRILLLFAIFITLVHVNSIFLSNLNEPCFHCLCEGATGCNETRLCSKGYCGPFYISRVYWADADKPVMPEDDPERDGAYQDCANQFACAKRTVERYMAKFGRDCNNDGVTTCEDYALLHYNGGYHCEGSLEGTKFYDRYQQCRMLQAEGSGF